MDSQIKIHISDKRPFANGKKFGKAGAYERIIGKASFYSDPNNKANRNVTDIRCAEVNADGLIEFISDFIILKPVDLEKGNSCLFYDYGNRGNIKALQFFNDAVGTTLPLTEEHAGNGFLFRRGYSILFAAWQGDILPGNNRLILNVPLALDKNKRPFKGQIRTEFIVENKGVCCLPVSGFITNRGHPTTSLDSQKCSLTRRQTPFDRREEISPHDWKFARVEEGPGMDGQNLEQSIIPSPIHIYYPTGFDPGWIYELIYEGSDPLVLGCGYIAVRNLVSFFRYGKKDINGFSNPFSDSIKHAYCWGRSQTGRLIRDTLYLGFNSDEQNRKVFDGVMPHVSGAGRMWLNHRFAIGASPAGQQFEAHDNPADRFPFAYSECYDPITEQKDSILKNPETDPFIIHTQTSTEYWQRRGSLVHTDMYGNDLKIPENVRIYFWSSSQHYTDPLNHQKPTLGVCQQLQNTVRTSMFSRALLDILDSWVRFGKIPPDNQVPQRSDETLITFDEWRQKFPKILNINVPKNLNTLSFFNFGADIESSTPLTFPPKLVKKNAYPIYVPSTDCDGNDVAGIRAPMVEAPLGTYLGWNLRKKGFGEGYMFLFNGSTIPFLRTKKEVTAKKDPRLSIEERYDSPKKYTDAIREASLKLVKRRFLLAEDVERMCYFSRISYKKLQ